MKRLIALGFVFALLMPLSAAAGERRAAVEFAPRTSVFVSTWSGWSAPTWGGWSAPTPPPRASVFPTVPDPWRNWAVPPAPTFYGPIVPAPPAPAVWVPGGWYWDGVQWLWVPGHWSW